MSDDKNNSAQNDYALKKKAMGIAIFSLCLSEIGNQLFLNSFVLMFLATLNISSDMILVYLALPSLVVMLLQIPMAHYASRLGYVKTTVLGGILSGLAMCLLLLSPSLGDYGLTWLLILLGVLLHGVGVTLDMTGWFPLASLIVPESERGGFFGRLRFTYQLVSILFTFLVVVTLKIKPSVSVFQFFLGLAILAKAIGMLSYYRLSVYEPPSEQRACPGMISSLLRAIGTPGYMPFCSYVFLLTLATGSCTSLFGLLAKGPLGLSENQVVLIGNLGTAGALAGYLFGGRMVDRLGTKVVFLICHFAFGAILLCFLTRVFVPSSAIIVLIGALSMLFGMTQAASGIAIASEMLALTPPDNKPMSTALNMMLMYLGLFLSGLFSARMIKMGILSESWNLWGGGMSQYDSLLLLCAVVVIILTVTLGLVPSVVKKIQW